VSTQSASAVALCCTPTKMSSTSLNPTTRPEVIDALVSGVGACLLFVEPQCLADDGAQTVTILKISACLKIIYTTRSATANTTASLTSPFLSCERLIWTCWTAL